MFHKVISIFVFAQSISFIFLQIYFHEVQLNILPPYIPQPIPLDIPCASSLGYRNMCRFQAKTVYELPILKVRPFITNDISSVVVRCQFMAIMYHDLIFMLFLSRISNTFGDLMTIPRFWVTCPTTFSNSWTLKILHMDIIRSQRTIVTA